MRHAARQLPSWLIFDVGQSLMNSGRRKNWRRVYEALEKRKWEFVGSSEEGSPFAIDGVDVWSQEWKAGRSRPSVHVKNPNDGMIIEVGVYSIGSGERKVRFAAGAFSDSIFGFYIPRKKGPNKAPEPTPGAVTPRATEGSSE